MPTLLDVQQGAWRRLQGLTEKERQHGSSLQVAKTMQECERDLVTVLSLPENTQFVELTADGVRVVI